ncbi:putative motility protein [Pseudomonas sp.]|uniref:putative motility protein n=1 Tax=Pseudomonas sp. TaxID=306 RepID=UPI003BB49C56
MLELSSLTHQVSTQASALASLLLLRKTLERQAASIGGLVQAGAPASAPSNPPNLGNSVDLMV